MSEVTRRKIREPGLSLIIESDGSVEIETPEGNIPITGAAEPHDHEGVYSEEGHTHEGGAPHDHDADYEALGHNHDGTYSPDAHDHDADYAGLSHAHLDADIPAGIARDSEVTSAVSNHVTAEHTGLATDAEVTSAISTHEGAANPHPTYETSAEAAAKVTAHEALSDPHTGYQRESEKAAASGYASLDANTLVPVAQHGTGTPDGTKFLRDDRVWATPTGAPTPDARLTTKVMSSDQADITGTGLVELTALTCASLAAGTYQFTYRVIYQTTATTTGVEFVVDSLATVDRFVSNMYFGSTGGAAATGIADQAGVGTAAGIMETKTARAENTRPGVTIGVDTANADMLMVIEGVIRTTTSGDLKLMMAAELAALVVRARAGSSLVLVKVD